MRKRPIVIDCELEGPETGIRMRSVQRVRHVAGKGFHARKHDMKEGGAEAGDRCGRGQLSRIASWKALKRAFGCVLCNVPGTLQGMRQNRHFKGFHARKHDMKEGGAEEPEVVQAGRAAD